MLEVIITRTITVRVSVCLSGDTLLYPEQSTTIPSTFPKTEVRNSGPSLFMRILKVKVFFRRKYILVKTQLSLYHLIV